MIGCLIVLILLAACSGQRRAPPEAIYENARQELRRGNLDKAAAQADLGFRQWRAEASSPWYWRFRLLQAEVLLTRGKAKEALLLLEAQLPDRPEFSELLARQRLHQGRAAFLSGEYPKAKKLLDETLELASKIDSPTLLAEVELRRGSVFVRLGDFVAADASYRNALEIGIRQGDLYLQAAALGNLGFRLVNHSRYDEALPFFERAMAASERIGSRDFTARILGNLGLCYYGLGDTDRALRLLSEAEALDAQIGRLRGRQIWLGDIGIVYYSLRDFRNAISYYHRALALARELGESFSIAEWLNDLAQVSIDAGDLTAAESYNREALALGERMQNPNYRMWPLLNAARISAARKQFEQAERFYSDVRELARKQEDQVALWEAQAGLANLFVATQQWQRAKQQFQSALSTIEGSRSKLARDEWKFTFLAHLIRFYQDYVDFLMDRQETEKALQVAESCRARVLAEKLGAQAAGQTAVTSPQLRERARALNAVLLSYWVAPRRSFLWVISPKAVTPFVLPDEPAIRKGLEAYQGAILRSRDPLETANPSGLQLYQALVAPAERLIPTGARLILVPDGPLHELNFETLLASSSRTRYWIEDVTIAVAPSLGVLSSRKANGPGPKESLLMIGNPLPPSPEFPPLPDAEREIDSIQGCFRPSERSVFTQASARPGIYREVNPRRFSMIHFAAHATANRESPLDSAVILSPQADSYKLYAREVMAVPLEAQLVTISACRSAGARAYSGEGLVGFTWAFLQAGAHNVIAGLWDVSDRSTSELMANLYSGLANGLGPAEALRAAKLALLRSSGPYRKPYYWAPFQVFTRSMPFQDRPRYAARRS